jgi:hypothetical protein
LIQDMLGSEENDGTAAEGSDLPAKAPKSSFIRIVITHRQANQANVVAVGL